MIEFTQIPWTGNIAFDFFFNLVFFFTLSAFSIRAIINIIFSRRY
jgi:hypothetical protein